MEAPNYIGVLHEVAESLGAISDHTTLYDRLQRCWNEIEQDARTNKWDILAQDYDTSQLKRMVELLYATPNANYRHDLNVIREKDREYGGSWYRRGGAGAFMMLARKWDRIEAAVTKHGTAIFVSDQRVEGIQDDFGDLRRYLLLVLSWHRAKEFPPVQEDLVF